MIYLYSQYGNPILVNPKLITYIEITTLDAKQEKGLFCRIHFSDNQAVIVRESLSDILHRISEPEEVK